MGGLHPVLTARPNHHYRVGIHTGPLGDKKNDGKVVVRQGRFGEGLHLIFSHLEIIAQGDVKGVFGFVRDLRLCRNHRLRHKVWLCQRPIIITVGSLDSGEDIRPVKKTEKLKHCFVSTPCRSAHALI